MVLISNGDRDAFGRLLERHLNSVNGFILRIAGGNRSMADDLSQETFLRVWQKASLYKPGKVKVSTWIHTIAHNLSVDQFRKKTELLGDLQYNADAVVDESRDPSDELSRRQDSTRLDRLIRQLPLNQRSAIALCHIHGFSNRDAAAILGIGLRALESLLARARRTLKNELETNHA